MADRRRTGMIDQRNGARAARRPKAIRYPVTDDEPMAETQLHGVEAIRLIETLQDWFRDLQDVYVWGNLLLYYEEGNRKASVSPDVFVVKGVPKRPLRDTYLLWAEGAPPAVVIEISSKSTQRRDRGVKREIYARIGVREYILYDPRVSGQETRYPPLQGYRLVSGAYEPLPEAAEGGLLSVEVGLRLVLEAGRLRLYNAATGALLLSPAERLVAAEERIAQLEALLRERQPPP